MAKVVVRRCLPDITLQLLNDGSARDGAAASFGQIRS